jgi:hypothetical protein
MKIGELASALNKLGKVYKHKNGTEPVTYIAQVLRLLDGPDDMELETFLIEKQRPKPKKIASESKPKIDLDVHTNALLEAVSEIGFSAAISALKDAKPTVEDLKQVVFKYTNIARKSGTKASLLNAIETHYTKKRRGAVRNEADINPPM